MYYDKKKKKTHCECLLSYFSCVQLYNAMDYSSADSVH